MAARTLLASVYQPRSALKICATVSARLCRVATPRTFVSRAAQPCTPEVAAAIEESPSTSAHATPDQRHQALERARVPECLVRRKGAAVSDDGRLLLKGLRYEELVDYVTSLGESKTAADRLWGWMYSVGDPKAAGGRVPRLIRQAQLDATRVNADRALRKRLVAYLREHADLDAGLELQTAHRASDGTTKLVFKCKWGEAAGGTVETVLIPMQGGLKGAPRFTVCISSQVGCAMNCQFCYTGRMGLLANLGTAQIVEQVVEARRYVREWGDGSAAVSNVVFMGMGEPMHNVDSVLAAADILTTQRGLSFSRSTVVISTVGLIPEIRRHYAESRTQLAVSLHATTDEVRNWIAPINRKYPLSELMGTLRELFPKDAEAANYGRYVLIEYVMLRDVNDGDEDARRLVELTDGIHCAINLIVFNPHEGTKFFPSNADRVQAFKNILRDGQRIATVRDSRGDDEMAACGQLGNLGLSEKRAPMLKVPEKFRAAVAPQ